jgi:hypothetical protein
VRPLDVSLFDEVAAAARGSIAGKLGEPRMRPRRWGLKLWFGGETPTREHYEAQVIGPQGVEGATVLALEIGFHAEHSRASDNDEVMARLIEAEARWRKVLGPEPVVGPFLGGVDSWRRISETWPDPDLGAPDLAIEMAVRLGEYVTALEPLRRKVTRRG